jgi:imipenem/basic amino acid-specific outer membrane pore
MSLLRCLSVLSTALLVGAVQAGESGVWESGVRLGFFQSNQLDVADDGQIIAAAGGVLRYISPEWHGLWGEGALFAVWNPGFNPPLGAGYSEIFAVDGDSFVLPGELNLQGSWNAVHMVLGRQALETPHASADDIRMMPNRFDALTMDYQVNDSLDVSAGWINSMGGWENGIDTARFVNLGQVLGVGDIAGMGYVSSEYRLGTLDTQAWAYHITDVANLFYFEIGQDRQLSSVWSWQWGAQLDIQHATGDEILGDVHAHVWGLRGMLAHQRSGLSLEVALNSTSGETFALTGFGGGPFFTSMEDRTLSIEGDQPRAYKLALGLDLGVLDAQGLRLELAHGGYRADGRTGLDELAYEENDFLITYAPVPRIAFEAVFADIDNMQGSEEDTEQWRVRADIQF